MSSAASPPTSTGRSSSPSWRCRSSASGPSIRSRTTSAATSRVAQFWAQVYALPVAIVAMLVFMLVDYGTLTRRSIFMYAALVLGLFAVLSFGVTRGGAQRWITFGSVTLQPSEFARLVVALVLAGFYGAINRSPKRLTALVAGAALLGLPAFLIYKQPDLGTAVTLIPVFLGIVYLAGVRHAVAGDCVRRGRAALARRVDVRAQGLSERTHRDVSGSVEGSSRGRVSADSGARDRRVGRADGQGLQARDPGGIWVPSRRAQRLRLFRAGRRAGLSRRAGDARALSVRHRAQRRRRPSWPRIASARSWWSQSFRDSRSRCCTTSPCRRGWPR